jgi:hypothetical protein
MEDSEVSGGKKIVYGTSLLNITIPAFDEEKSYASVAPPMYYIIPPQYKDVIEVLRLHGVKFTRLQSPNHRCRELPIKRAKMVNFIV